MGRPGPPAAAPRAVARTSAAGSAFSRSEPFGWAPASPGPPRTTCCRWARARPAAGGGGGWGWSATGAGPGGRGGGTGVGVPLLGQAGNPASGVCGCWGALAGVCEVT